MSDWKSLNNETRQGFWYGARWLIAVVLLMVVIGAGLWGLGVFSSGVKGKGDAVRTKNSGTNRIAAQERFEELYAGVKAADLKIGVAADALKRAPDDVVAQVNYTGSINYCIGLRADYDAEARKYTAEAWRSTDLPQQIDQGDAATDCHEPKESK